MTRLLQPSRRSSLIFVVAAIGALALAPAMQATNGYFAHGYGTQCKALAGACTALPLDSLSSATNPAALAFVGKRFDAGVAVFMPSRSYEVEGNPSGFPGTFPLTPGKVESESTSSTTRCRCRAESMLPEVQNPRNFVDSVLDSVRVSENAFCSRAE